MEARGTAGMELSHPQDEGSRRHSRNSAKVPPEVPEPAPPRMSITNREIKHSHPQYNTGKSVQWDCVPSYTSKEQGEEREATRRGVVMGGWLFNSGDSLFLAFFHSPFHHPREKPSCLD